MRRLLLLLLISGPLLAADTYIKGGRMELIDKGETVLFTDGVQLDRGGDRLNASRMQTNKKRDKVTAEGNVKLFRQVSSTETWHGFGDKGFYNTQSGAGFLLGSSIKKARVVHTEVVSSTISRVVIITADRIDFLREAKRAYAKGFVKGDSADPETGEIYEFWSDEADFDGENNKVTLYGAYQPIVVQTASAGRRTVKGDKITYFTDGRRIFSEGRAQAVFEDDKSKRKK